jgi:hypothetical protein
MSDQRNVPEIRPLLPWTREELEWIRQKKTGGAPELLIAGMCHPDTGSNVEYRPDGIVRVTCRVCNRAVGELLIAARRDEANLLTVDRDGPIVETRFDTTDGLLEGLGSVLMAVIGEPGLRDDIRLYAGQLLGLVRAEQINKMAAAAPDPIQEG